MTTAHSIYRGASQAVRTGGESIIALYGAALGGIITNPETAAAQGIAPLLSYSTAADVFLEGPFNTYGYNSQPPFNGSYDVTKTTTITYLGPPELLYVSLVGPAELVESNTTYVLFPGQSFTVPRNCQSNVWVNAATSGHRFTSILIQPQTQYPPTLVESSFPPTGPTGKTTTIPSYLYQEYAGDDDLQAFVMTYNSISQAYVDWFNNLNLPIYTGLFGGLLDWVGAGLYGLPRPTLFSGTAHTFGPYNTRGFNTGPDYNGGGIVNNVTDVAVTSDDIYKRIITWFFFKGDGKSTSALWLKRRIYRFLYGTSGTDAEGPMDQISVIVTSSQIIITIITGLRRTVGGAFFNGMGFNTGPCFNAGSWSLTPYAIPAVAMQFQEAIETGALETPYQFDTTCRIGTIGTLQ